MAGMLDIQAALSAQRASFDAGFAAPARPPPPDLIPLLIVRAAGAAHAIPLADLMSLGACGVVVPLPGQRPACLGLTAFRGKPITVFDCAALLRPGARAQDPRWLAVIHAGIGFALEELIGIVHVPPDDLRHGAGTAGQRAVALATGLCPLVDLPALFTAPAARGGSRTL